MFRVVGFVDLLLNSLNCLLEVFLDKEDSVLDKVKEVGLDSVLDIGLVFDIDIFGDFEYELDDEDYIGVIKVIKVVEI